MAGNSANTIVSRNHRPNASRCKRSRAVAADRGKRRPVSRGPRLQGTRASRWVRAFVNATRAPGSLMLQSHLASGIGQMGDLSAGAALLDLFEDLVLAVLLDRPFEG